MNKAMRILLLPMAVLGLHGLFYALPESGKIAESAIRMDLPDRVDHWQLKTTPPSEREIKILAKDTDFAKAICLAPRPGEYGDDGNQAADRIDLSIVLSGHDLTNSIHRPERCMPSQGHDITATSTVTIQLANGHQFQARKLISTQNIQIGPEQQKALRMEGDVLKLKAVTYYFFVGRNRLTADHTQRTLFDMWDRLIHGIDQRWAYVSATTWYGPMPWLDKEVTEQEAETKIRQFLTKLAETQVDWKVMEK